MIRYSRWAKQPVVKLKAKGISRKGRAENDLLKLGIEELSERKKLNEREMARRN